MKYINITDTKWHNVLEELPSQTIDVEFLDKENNIIPNGHIFVDMSGAYASLKNYIGYTWTSFDNYVSWRFKL